MPKHPKPTRPLTYNGASGKFPAWVWQAIANAQRDTHGDGIPVVIAQVGLRKFMILDCDDWRDALTPPEPTKEPA
ncbi:MAG: hypothetical protein ACR2OE_05525 [Thermomicrobiales bacterium]